MIYFNKMTRRDLFFNQLLTEKICFLFFIFLFHHIFSQFVVDANCDSQLFSTNYFRHIRQPLSHMGEVLVISSLILSSSSFLLESPFLSINIPSISFQTIYFISFMYCQGIHFIFMQRIECVIFVLNSFYIKKVGLNSLKKEQPSYYLFFRTK